MSERTKRIQDTRAGASGAIDRVEDGLVVDENAPIAADIGLPLGDSAPVAAADPREIDGGLAPDRGSRTSAPVNASSATDTVITTGVTRMTTPTASMGTEETQSALLSRVREGMKVYDSAGDEIGKVDAVKMGDPAAAAPSPADQPGPNTLLDNVASAVAGAHVLPPGVTDELLRTGYLHVDGKGWIDVDRYVPAHAIANVAAGAVRLSVAKEDLVEG